MATAYVYMLPMFGEDWLKLGSSGDPLRRAREFSPRFFQLFDFEQALLVETGDRGEAGRVETALRRTLRAHRAPMPLEIRSAAGGHTEWLRGALPALQEAAADLAAQGHELHQGPCPVNPAWTIRAAPGCSRSCRARPCSG